MCECAVTCDCLRRSGKMPQRTPTGYHTRGCQRWMQKQHGQRNAWQKQRQKSSANKCKGITLKNLNQNQNNPNCIFSSQEPVIHTGKVHLMSTTGVKCGKAMSITCLMQAAALHACTQSDCVSDGK